VRRKLAWTIPGSTPTVHRLTVQLTTGSALFLRSVSFPKPPTSLLIFGSGAQAHSHATVFLRLLPTLSTVTFAVRARNDRATSLIDSLSDTFPGITFALEITSTSSGPADLTQVVGEADIIVTVTSSTVSLFPSSAVKPGARLVLVGSYTPKMREVEDELIKRAGVIVVDSKEACGHEAGELISAGVTDEGMVEIGKIVSDQAARESVGRGGDVVIFKSVSRCDELASVGWLIGRSGWVSRTSLSPSWCLTLRWRRAWGRRSRDTTYDSVHGRASLEPGWREMRTVRAGL